MPKTVLDVGNCAPDHAAIRRMLTNNFDVTVLQTDQAQDTLELLAKQPVDLILVNRKLDCDYSDGMRIIEQLKGDQRYSSIPVMLVTNYEDHQDQAVSVGALRGFGKLALSAPETLASLGQVLN
ncbi:MAG: response regulator [Planctomycetales bacterium]|nr:response regulator [Planctomycetales bacterium]MCA9168165.1 response regulator [Planctomycetales bacterium]